MNATTHQLTDTDYLLATDDPDQFTCGIEETTIRLVLMAEIVDHQAHGIPHPDGYPLGIQFAILPDARDVNDETREKAAGCAPSEFTELDMAMYSGGIPIQNAEDIIGEPAEGIDYIMDGEHVNFADHQDAEAYIDQALENLLPQLAIMVGFFLDRQINMIGSTGWDRLREWCIDPDYNGLTPGL